MKRIAIGAISILLLALALLLTGRTRESTRADDGSPWTWVAGPANYPITSGAKSDMYGYLSMTSVVQLDPDTTGLTYARLIATAATAVAMRPPSTRGNSPRSPTVPTRRWTFIMLSWGLEQSIPTAAS